MRIVFFSHPHFLGSQSMPRFTSMLMDGMKQYGHEVELWLPKPRFYNLRVPNSMKKWMGYVDQFIFFPNWVRRKLKSDHQKTLFVFTDHALGPWVPLVSHMPHVIHCHDFLAQRSALGEIPENPLGYTGKIYQSYIRTGFQKGDNFISVSQKTRSDLSLLLLNPPKVSEMVYNGMNQSFDLQNVAHCRSLLSLDTDIDLSSGYILHVGGNQWYKNRIGVFDIYEAWRNSSNKHLPLLLFGVSPNDKLKMRHVNSPYRSDIYFLSGKSDSTIKLAYGGATVLLFPSLAEGFGWPIAEAMACGCPVITTGEAPMSEVGGEAARYIPRRPAQSVLVAAWAEEAAREVEFVVNLSEIERERLIALGVNNAKRFDKESALRAIEKIYKQVLANS